MEYVLEKERKTPVADRTQVLVAGGGIAGVSAALAAARTGAKTLLIEREWLLGGLATLGLITIFLPVCDGQGHQVVGGIGEELIRLSLKHGMEKSHLPYPAPWVEPDGTPEKRKEIRWQTQYNPCLYALELEQLLLKAGVEIRYGALISDVVMDGNRIQGVILQDKSGRSCVFADAVVDCTGDADLCQLSGAPTVCCESGNKLAAWHYAETAGGRRLRMVGCLDVSEDMASSVQKELEADPGKNTVYSGLDAVETSRMMQAAHAVTLQRYRKEKKRDPAYEPVLLPAIPQLRMTRRLQGAYTLDEAEEGTYFSQSVGMTGDWRKRGPVFEIPAGILYCGEVEHLYVAGRCVSVTESMWDITRVIPCCAVTGQAAGTAAALQALHGQWDISELQTALIRDHALLHLRDAIPPIVR
ncbi:MAG: FAD-dependent oxidoreductase [Clostridia bacterium]|nr:FAD-dependent oxidoreductase [Clostridia bacterium]